MGLDLHTLELESAERLRTLRQQAEQWRLAAPLRRAVLREAVAAGLIALARRLAPSLQVTVTQVTATPNPEASAGAVR